WGPMKLAEIRTEDGDTVLVGDGKRPGWLVGRTQPTDAGEGGDYSRALWLVNLSPSQALELANALTHGKLQGLLDALDAFQAIYDEDESIRGGRALELVL